MQEQVLFKKIDKSLQWIISITFLYSFLLIARQLAYFSEGGLAEQNVFVATL